MCDSEETKPVQDAQRLVDEGIAILQHLDELEERESKVRTMGNMAYSSYRSDWYHTAMRKFEEALIITTESKGNETAWPTES